MVVVKRLRVSEKGEGINLHSIEDAMPMNHHHQHTRVFKCKTCGKRFTSFQALGGHRASHKRPRLVVAVQDLTLQVAASKPKVHECSICGVEFAIGQALGGHMRRHRARVDQGCSSGEGGLCLDLSLASSGDMNSVGSELELGLSLGLGLGHVHRSRTTMVKLFH